MSALCPRWATVPVPRSKHSLTVRVASAPSRCSMRRMPGPGSPPRCGVSTCARLPRVTKRMIFRARTRWRSRPRVRRWVPPARRACRLASAWAARRAACSKRSSSSSRGRSIASTRAVRPACSRTRSISRRIASPARWVERAFVRHSAQRARAARSRSCRVRRGFWRAGSTSCSRGAPTGCAGSRSSASTRSARSMSRLVAPSIGSDKGSGSARAQRSSASSVNLRRLRVAPRSSRCFRAPQLAPTLTTSRTQSPRVHARRSSWVAPSRRRGLPRAISTT